MQKHSQHNNDEQTPFFRKIYLSQFYSKWLQKGYVWEVSWRQQNCNILTPSCSGYSSTSFSFSWAAQPGALRAASPQSGAGSHAGILSPKPGFQLPEIPVAPGYIIVCCPPASCGLHICTQLNPSTVKVIPWCLQPDAPVIYTGAFLIWQLGRVGGQYATDLQIMRLINYLHLYQHIITLINYEPLDLQVLRLINYLLLDLHVMRLINYLHVDLHVMRLINYLLLDQHVMRLINYPLPNLHIMKSIFLFNAYIPFSNLSFLFLVQDCIITVVLKK